MLRHIAIDEQNTIVNLYNLDEIDANKHTYFCIACGKEVFVDVDDRGNYSFLHLDENIPCEDDFYLHEAAKRCYVEDSTLNISSMYIYPNGTYAKKGISVCSLMKTVVPLQFQYLMT